MKSITAIQAERDQKYMQRMFNINVTRPSLYQTKVKIDETGEVDCVVENLLEVFPEMTCTSVTCLVEDERCYLFFDAAALGVVTYILHYVKELNYPEQQDVLHEIMNKVKRELGVEGEGFVLPGDANYVG